MDASQVAAAGPASRARRLGWVLRRYIACAANAETATTVLRPLERSILTKVNAVRHQHGLAQVRLSAGLAAAARHRSTEMASCGYFGHSASANSRKL
jgi:uncharacterized protein YkwD